VDTSLLRLICTTHSCSCVYIALITVLYVAQMFLKRSSANQPTGTMEMKPIKSVNKDVIRAFTIEKVLPALSKLAAWRCQQA
jgi:hypothetical protein